MDNKGGNEETAQAHHPWDEVSLPGAEATEQPTILQVFNQVNTDDESITKTTNEVLAQNGSLDEKQTHITTHNSKQAESSTDAQHATPSVASADSEDTTAARTRIDSDNLVSSHSKNPSNSRISNTRRWSNQSSTETESRDQQSTNVLDIESHLIETYEHYHAKEDSVGINELPPIKDELTECSSKIETECNVRSVIEVEPAGSKRKKLVQTLLLPQHPQSFAEINNTAATETDEVELLIREDISEDIRETANKLVQEIEQQVLDALRTEFEKPKECTAKEILITLDPAAYSKSAEVSSKKLKTDSSILEADTETKLSKTVEEQLTEVTSILKAIPINVNVSGVDGETITVLLDKPVATEGNEEQVKIVELNGLPSPNTVSEEAERKLFIDSLPQFGEDTDATKLAVDCKREYYQSLRKYLVQNNPDRPPIPLQTYRWEDLRRAKERGGYPWTHLYKRPLGADEEPELVLLLRQSQELHFTSESPKSLKKVRYDEQVLVKETERYIQELSEEEEEHSPDSEHPKSSDEECHSLQSESISCVSDSVLAVGKPRNSKRLGKLRGILKRHKSVRSTDDAQSLPGTSIHNSRHHSEDNLSPQRQLLVNGQSKGKEQKTTRCFSIMKKLRNMADRQKKRLNIKRIPLKKEEKIVLGEETKILKLKSSPKSERGEIPHFIEKQDSDDVLEIVELDESPSRKRKDDGRDHDDIEITAVTASVVEPDEIIEITNELKAENDDNDAQTPEPTVSEILEEEIKSSAIQSQVAADEPPPRKTPRLRREHVYEEIDQGETVGEQISEILELASMEALKHSLLKQDDNVIKDLAAANKPIPLDRMGSSEEEATTAAEQSTNLLAPISSIDSASSDEDRGRPLLSPVAEESDVASIDGQLSEQQTKNAEENESTNTAELKPSIKKESSPAPSDKKVTFSHVEDEAEPHREDIELPQEVQEAAGKRWKNMSDHEYEPIGEPHTEEKFSNQKEPSPAPQQVYKQHQESQQSMDIDDIRDEMKEAEELQKDLEDRYLSSEATTPRTESRTDYEIHTSQVDSSALEELPLRPENRKKGFMASAQDRTRKMQAGFKTQAGKIKTKLRSPAKKPPSDSPKAKDRKRFKAPEFSKMKMPEIKRPDMTKLKDFKRPEFTKFNKPDMSKFKFPEKFSTLKLRRSKSFKENEPTHDENMSGVAPELSATAEAAPQKKMFDFNFGTYPRAFRKKKKPLEPEPSFDTGTGTEEPSVIPSTETQPSLESSSSPQGDRGPGPVRSRWADKFSDVSYNDSEGSRYRRYGSEQESFDRESSLERRMREDLEEAPSEETNLGILGGVTDNQQFAEFDEENRAIHEISNLRAGEFKRRPMVHQDSDLVSEESKDAVGWTDKEIQKNKLLRKAELEAESSYLNYPLDERVTHDTQSTASSGKKVVMEEIDDDEFFLRKRGVSEDNIELRQYISTAIREGFDMPINALQHVGQTREPMEYGDYDIPPPKPRRLHKNYRPEDVSQEFDMRHSEYDDDMSVSHNGSEYFGAPKRPMRKGRSRSKYSMDSQDVTLPETLQHEQYFDDDEEYLRPPRTSHKDEDVGLNNLSFAHKEVKQDELNDDNVRPEAPRRRKRHQRETSMEKDSFINGFGGRSVSNSYLQPPEDVIVYRTEHEYHIPLATPENCTDGASASSRKSRSISRFEDDRTSHGAESLAMDQLLKNELEEAEAKLERASAGVVQEKFIIDMMESDGYAVVRKEHLPKPTPPARRKKFSRSPGERFATLPNMRAQRGSPPPPERPPPPRGYSPAEPTQPHRKSALSLDEPQNIEDDYEELQELDHERPESPRNLQSGDIINKMKYRPLPPPPRPPREKRQRGPLGKGQTLEDAQDDESNFDDRDGGGEHIATSSTAESYDQNGDFEDDLHFVEVEVSTQTDPLPDDFICEEFEITADMKIIEPRNLTKTLEDMLIDEQIDRPLTEDEQLARGLQRFRDANQRSLSEKSRASSQADRSKSLSRPQTPSAVIIERRVSTPIPNRDTSESMLEAALIVRPIEDLDLEEEALRREGLLTDSSQQSKSDVESRHQEEKIIASDYSQEPSTIDLEEAMEEMQSQIESEIETEDDKEVERTMQERSPEFTKIQEEVQRRLNSYVESEKIKEKLALVEVIKSSIAPSETTPPPTYVDEFQDDFKEEFKEDPVKYDHERKLSKDLDSIQTIENEREKEVAQEEVPQTPPQPPPRRRSSITIEPNEFNVLTQVEQVKAQDVTAQHMVAAQPTLPAHLAIADLEVERLNVHALQAGQIMVSQLYGTQIRADDLECKSGNLVVNNIELPPGFIENIVERVRNTERSQLHAAETQTSRQASDEALAIEQATPPAAQELVPPPKPPRQRTTDVNSSSSTLPSETVPQLSQQRLPHVEEDTINQSTQTMETTTSSPSPPPPAFPTVEYLRSLAPLAFYNLRNLGTDAEVSQRSRRRYHRRSRESTPSEEDNMNDVDPADFPAAEINTQVSDRHRRRTRSITRPAEPQSVAQAGRQFLSACSLSLVNIINQLTDSVRGEDKDQDPATRARQVPTLVVLFILITFGILLFLLSGKSIHHHHWDFFNPPGNDGRAS